MDTNSAGKPKLAELRISERDAKNIGRNATTGALDAAWSWIGKWALIGILAVAAFTVIRNVNHWGMDDSDVSTWDRSNLTVHTDALTGVQYLENSKGFMVVRVDGDGKPVARRVGHVEVREIEVK